MASLFSRRKARRPVKIGLALGSGSARGWAHIGVINALTEAGVRIDCVAGTSIGSLVGAVFASGKTASLETVVRELDWRRALALFDVGLPRSGLLDGRKVTASIREHVSSGDIGDLPMPFCAVSTEPPRRERGAHRGRRYHRGGKGQHLHSWCVHSREQGTEASGGRWAGEPGSHERRPPDGCRLRYCRRPQPRSRGYRFLARW